MEPQDQILSRLPRQDGLPRLGPCVVLAKLGQGGQGAVYRARHLELQIEVALKCLDPQFAARTPAAQARFLKEARLAARVSNENLVRMFEVGEEHGLSFLVMELVAGETALRRVQRKGALQPQEAGLITLAAARGLKALHDLQIVHRDVKPENVLLTPAGIVKLADLGLARDLSADGTLTGSGLVMGTPRYMAPEQWEGAHEAQRPADVFALGATLFFLLAGRDGLQAPTGLLLRTLMTRGFPDVLAVRPQTPAPLAEIIRRCTRVVPLERYAHAGELVADLARALGVSDPERGVPPAPDLERGPQPEREPGVPRRTRARPLVFGLAGLTLAAGTVAWWSVSGAASPRLPSQPATRVALEPGNEATSGPASPLAGAPASKPPASRPRPPTPDVLARVAFAPPRDAVVRSRAPRFTMVLPEPLRARVRGARVADGAPLTQDGSSWSGQLTDRGEGPQSWSVLLSGEEDGATWPVDVRYAVDTELPQVQLLGLADGDVLDPGVLPVRVAVIDRTECLAWIQGQPATATAGGFAASVELGEQDSALRIRVVDAAQNPTELTIRVRVRRFPGIDLHVTLPAVWTLRLPIPESPPLAFDLVPVAMPDGATLLLGRIEVTQRMVAPFRKASGVVPEVNDLPVTRISWHDAMQYVAWLQKHMDAANLPYSVALPTFEELRFAAVGDQNWRYPWGNDQPTSGRANLLYEDGEEQLLDRPEARSAGASRDGVLDLLGNVWEWCADEPKEPGTRCAFGFGFQTLDSAATDIGDRSWVLATKPSSELGMRLCLRVATRQPAKR